MPAPSTPVRRRELRPTVIAAVIAVIAGAGVTLIADAQRSSGAPIGLPVRAAPAESGTAVPEPATTMAPGAPVAAAVAAAPAPVPPAPATTAPPATGAARPVAPAPAAAAKPASPPRPRPPAPPPAARGPAPQDSAAQLRQVQAIADTSGWDWRGVHVNFKVGFDPEACCHWGVYDQADHKTIWVGPTAFGDDTRLRYVVLHELGHAWQWHTHRLKKLEADLAPWGYADIDALEAGADCIAADWGASVDMGHYWVCPPDARALMARRLAGQWK